MCRESDHYVTVRDPDTEKRWLLKERCTSMTSNVNDLSARLRRRMETEDQEMNATAERELRTFGEMLSGGATHKQHTVTAAMEDEIGRMHGLLRRAWLRPLVTSLVVGLSLFLGILGGSWGLMQWQSSRVKRLLETQETYRRGIAQEQRAIDQLLAQTWGVWLHDDADGMRCVVLPRGTLNEEWPVTVLGAACHQAFQRVRAWYDRTRNTLDGRLKSLSTQWDADQQQHVEELDILCARIDDLAQLVTDYAAQHEQHAAALEQQATALQA